MFDTERPCSTQARSADRYTRAELVRLAADTDIRTVGRGMDEICADFRQRAAAIRRKKTPGGQLPSTAPVRASADSIIERCPPGYTYYRGYERRTPSGGLTQIAPSCRRKTSVYAGSRREWEAGQLEAKREREEAAEKYFAERDVEEPVCGPGEILVDAYMQPSTGRFVNAYCRKDMGLPGRGPPSGTKPVLLKKDRLSPFGYSILPERLAVLWDLERKPGKRKAAELRRQALLAAIESETAELVRDAGYTKRDAKSLVALSVSRRLQALARFARNARPDQAAVYEADAEWIRKQSFYLAGK